MINFFGTVFSPLTNLLGSGLEFFHAQGLPWWLSIAFTHDCHWTSSPNAQTGEEHANV